MPKFNVITKVGNFKTYISNSKGPIKSTNTLQGLSNWGGRYLHSFSMDCKIVTLCMIDVCSASPKITPQAENNEEKILKKNWILSSQQIRKSKN